ncbi:MAG: FkbM family methyltransferase [Chlamydiota bacterium]|nr:FkbM family methyltransferase [Chlamydiota bacterium]
MLRCFLFISVFAISTFVSLSGESSYSHVDCNGVPLDQKLIELLDYPNGVFIEAGANDGVKQSNTKRLEEFYGWRGILVEPSENLYDTLVTNRPQSHCFLCALGSFEEDNTYAVGDFNGSLMSSINGVRQNNSSNQTVLVRSLQSIIDEVGFEHIDLLSLDTEGYELNILQGIDFNKVSFGYLLIEIYTHQFEEIVSFLENHGYELVENFSNYSLETNPFWDGTHNDYLFKKVK